MLEGAAKTTFSLLAGSPTLRRLAHRYGMRREESFARRFIAGETIEEAIHAARALEREHLAISLDYLGEPVSSSAAAAEATRTYLAFIGEVQRAGIGRNISVSLTQLGIDVDRATSIDNLRRVLDAAAKAGVFVRIAMERSTQVEQTLEAFETLWNIGYHNGGVVIPSYLHRSAADVRRVNALGASVRLVKGSYDEPRNVAFRHRHEIDASFVDLMKVLLQHGTQPAIATHDPAMIAATTAFAAAQGIGKDRYEFQMLYGIRRDLQISVAAEGYQCRVRVPFGRDWFPYFMRRLGERPANLGTVVKSILKERR